MAADDDLSAALEAECPDPGPCVNGPTPHQWHTSCQEDRDL